MNAENRFWSSSSRRTRWVLAASLVVVAVSLAAMTHTSVKMVGNMRLRTTLQVEGRVNSVAFEPTGQRLAVLSNFGSAIAVYSVRDWSLEKKVARYGGGYSFNSLAFPNDATVVTSTPIGSYGDDPRSANSPLFDHRYNRVDNASLMGWNWRSGSVERYFPPIGVAPQSNPDVTSANLFAASHDGEELAAVNVSGIHIFDARTGTLRRTLVLPPNPTVGSEAATSVTFSGGNDLVVGTNDGRVIIFDPLDGRVLHSFSAYERDEYSISAIAVSPDGQEIITGKKANFDGRRIGGVWRVRVHSLVGATVWTFSGEKVAELSMARMGSSTDSAPAVRSVSLNSTGSALAIATDRGFELWKLASRQATSVTSQEVSGGCYSIAFSINDVLAVAADSNVWIYQ